MSSLVVASLYLSLRTLSPWRDPKSSRTSLIFEQSILSDGADWTGNATANQVRLVQIEEGTQAPYRSTMVGHLPNGVARQAKTTNKHRYFIAIYQDWLSFQGTKSDRFTCQVY